MATILTKAESSTSFAQPKDGNLYVRVQLPNTSTTVMPFQADMTMWEVLNVISAKKELIPSQHVLKVYLNDGSHKLAEEARSLDSYQNLERIVVEQTIFPNSGRLISTSTTQVPELKPPRAITRRTSVIHSPTNVTISTRVITEFPKTITDTETLSKKIASLKSQNEYTTKSSTLRATKMKSLTMLLFKRGQSETSMEGGFGEGSYFNSSAASLATSSTTSDPDPDDVKEASNDDIIGELMSAMSPWGNTSNTDTLFSPNRGSFIEKSHMDASSFQSENANFLNIYTNRSSVISQCTTDEKSLSIVDDKGSMDGMSISKPSPPVSEASTSIIEIPASITSSINDISQMKSEASMLKMASAGDLGSIHSLSPISETSRVSIQIRKRTISSPSTSSSNSGTIRRSALHKPATINPPSQKEDNPTPWENVDIEDRIESVENLQTIPETPSKHFIIRIILPNEQTTMIKIPKLATIEKILTHVCHRRNLDVDIYTLQINTQSPPVVMEMDKPIEYYQTKYNSSDIHVVKGEKLYSTMCISEGDQDVLILRRVEERVLVMAGTIDNLMERITDEQECIDMSFHDTLLLTFRSFMTAGEFFENLLARFYCELPADPTPADVEYFNKIKAPTQRRVIGTVLWWAQHHWHDFGLSTELRTDLLEFARWLMACKETDFYAEGKRLQDTIQKQTARYESMLNYYRSVDRKGKTMESMFQNLSPEDLAKQLCIHDFQLFKYIHPIEVLNEIWKKDAEGSPSLDFFIQRFDKESYWVATELVQIKDFKKRVAALKHFILTAKACQDLHNFYSMFALIAGLNLSPVQRLKKTWEALPEKPKKIFQDLEKLSDPSKNMKNYRDSLAACQPPIVPFLPIYLKDLTFMNDGNEAKIRGMINFDKLRMMANRVRDISSLASNGYRFEPNPPILNYLAKPPIEKSMTKLKQMSLECENNNK